MADSTATRTRANVESAPRHPARFTVSIVDAITDVLERRLPVDESAGLVPRILDPFAGTGRIHQLRRAGYETVGVEIEPEWAELSAGTYCADATDLPDAWAGTFHCVATSPVYGNRMSDHHRATDRSERRSYTHDLQAMTGDVDRELHANNTGRLYAWQTGYWDLHRRAWSEAARMLNGHGLFILNTSDFVRSGEVVPVTAGHVEILESLGFHVIERVAVDTPRMRRGSNGDARVASEDLTVLRRRLRLVEPCPICGSSFACIGPDGRGRGCECAT